ncbi:lipopolysaccharide biosynthesis protein [Candidatus Saccharibacteria bacterium]|nr:lipopolysaccharide biosynthesis protein [Candidatus Saccharibacteria bacterium]
MTESTRHKVATNLAWRFAERVGARLVQFGTAIVLARMLGPDDYGTVALITVFIAIVQVFVDSGLGNALIQKKNADDIDFSTVFYTNIVFCAILYGAIFLFAPLIASFYNSPNLANLTRVLGLTVLVSGVKNVQQAYVSRKMIFRKFFFSTLAGTIGAAIVSIVMAYNGFGVWALVAQQVFNVTIDTLVLWVTVKWRPKLVFSFERLKGLFSYGWKLLVSGVLNAVSDNLRQLVIGKMYSSVDLAFYNRGRQFPDLVVNNINSSIDSVLLPTMSSVQEDKKRVKQMTRRSIKVSVFLMAPLMMGLAFTATNVIKVLLTDAWLPAVPYVAIFSVAFLFWPIHTANLNAIKAVGRSDIFLKLEVIKQVVNVAVLVVALNFGVLAIAISMVILGVFCQIINAWPNRKLIGYGYMEQLRDIAPGLLLAVMMGLAVFPLNYVGFPPIIGLGLQVILGSVIYIAGAKITKLDSYEYILNMIKSKIAKK